MERRTKIFIDTSTIKASKRGDLKNPITLAMNNLYRGFVDAGYDVVMSHINPRDTGRDYDVAVVFGSITRRKMDTERAVSIQKHRLANKKILSLDSAFFSTYIRNSINSPETNMFRIGVGDCVGSMPFDSANNNPDRYSHFEKTFSFEMKKPRTDGHPIMFILQTERGWQYDNEMPYKDWAREVIRQIRTHTNNTIILRAHPNHQREPLDYISKGFKNIQYQYGERARMSLIEDLTNVGCAITHSSSAAVETLVEGIPTIALDKRCIAYDACSNNIEDVLYPEKFDWSKRSDYFNKWANTTFHVDEMKKPEVINYNMNKLLGVNK